MSKILEHLRSRRAAWARCLGRGQELVGSGSASARGSLGAVVLGLRYAVRPPTKERIPETHLAHQSSRRDRSRPACGQMIYHEGGSGPGADAGVHPQRRGGGVVLRVVEGVPGVRRRAPRPRADLLGFGESERPKAKLTAADYAASLAEFVGASAATTRSAR